LRRTTRKGNESPDGVLLWYCEDHHGGAGTYRQLPNYTGDMNAMHAAFGTLSLVSQIEWHHHLYKIVKRRCADNLDDESVRMVAVNANASERAETFLRAIGKWQPEPEPSEASDEQ